MKVIGNFLCRSMHLIFGYPYTASCKLSILLEQAHFLTGDHNHSPFLRYTLNRSYPTTISYWICHSGIQPLYNFLLHYLLHRWIFTSLMLNTWLMIGHELDLIRTNAGRDPNNIRNIPPNSSFEPF